MRVSIIRADNRVTVDGKTYEVGCGNLPPIVHAVQWDGEFGEVEFVAFRDATGQMQKMPNQVITDFSPYQGFVDAWNSQRDVAEAEAKQRAAEAEAKQRAAEAEAANVARTEN